MGEPSLVNKKSSDATSYIQNTFTELLTKKFVEVNNFKIILHAPLQSL